jgi:hypothetical protein
MMARDHPLAGEGPVRLRDCLAHPHVLPSAEYGVRHLLGIATRRASNRLRPVVESGSFEFMRHYVLEERAVGFQIPIGLEARDGDRLVVREIATRDAPAGRLFLGHMRGRALPVAAARFAMAVAVALVREGPETG